MLLHLLIDLAQIIHIVPQSASLSINQFIIGKSHLINYLLISQVE